MGREYTPDYTPPDGDRRSSARRRFGRDYDSQERTSEQTQRESRGQSGSRSRSPVDEYKPRVGLRPWQDEYTLRSLHCQKCDVKLHDRDSMKAHLNGRQHLMQLRRLTDNYVRQSTGMRMGLNAVLAPVDFDPEFWNKNRGPRKLRPDQERMYDNDRFDEMPTKFDEKESKQYKLDEKMLHCEDCNVWVRSRSDMEAHKAGSNHQKRSAPIRRFECSLCLIQVPCPDTLDNHMRGALHMKKAAQLREKRRQRGEYDEDCHGGYRTGPGEMKKLENDEFEELERLRQETRIQKSKLKEYKGRIESLTKENERLKRTSLNGVKKEELRGCSVPSTSTSQPSVKTEVKREKRGPSEYVEVPTNDEIVLD